MKKSNLLNYHFVIQIITDVVILFLFYSVFFYWQYALKGIHVSFLQILMLQYKAMIIRIFIWLLCAFSTKLYHVTRFTKYYEVIRKVFIQMVIYSVFFVFFRMLFANRLPIGTFILFILALSIIMLTVRILYIAFADKYRVSGKNNWNVMFVDENHNTKTYISFIKKQKKLGLRFCGMFLVDKSTDEENKTFNFNIEDFKSFIRKNDVRIVFLSAGGKLSKEDEMNIRKYIYHKNITIYFIPSVYNDNFNAMEMQYINTFPVMLYKRFPLDYKYNQYFKRAFDLIFASLACVLVLSWLVPLVALAIKLDDGGKVFYIQKRIGFKGRRFNCLKFRSMRPCDENDIKNTQKNDDRITCVGRFLRKTSLDEFPQFINVFWGSMSIVGPRPHMVSEDEYYKKNIREYFLRHFVPPGITGLAQTSGMRGAVEGISGMEKRIAADTYYISKWSFILDIYIIFRTFIGLFKNDENAF